jgi:hypothetical protein
MSAPPSQNPIVAAAMSSKRKRAEAPTAPPPPPPPPPPGDASKAVGSVQLRPRLVEKDAPELVAALNGLEGVANHGGECAEWVGRRWLKAGVHPSTLTRAHAADGADEVTVTLTCRTHPKRCPWLCTRPPLEGAVALTALCNTALAATVDALRPQLDAFLAAVPNELRPKLIFGSDVTVRRTCGVNHAIDRPAGRPHDEGGGRAGVGGVPAMGGIHADSFDGLLLCFGLCSTKLGTPVYVARNARPV